MLGERNKVAAWQKPGAGRAQEDANRGRGPEHTGFAVMGPADQQHCVWVLPGDAESAQ